MMCTATAVFPSAISPLNRSYMGPFRDNEPASDPLSRNGWRDANNSSKDLASLMMSLSPISDRFGLFYRSRVAINSTTTRFDVISFLPIEISLAIFGCLNEQDLCRWVKGNYKCIVFDILCVVCVWIVNASNNMAEADIAWSHPFNYFLQCSYLFCYSFRFM